MKQQPDILAGDLRLRPFVPADAGSVQRLAGDERIADTTASIPHPYPDGAAEEFVRHIEEKWAAGGGVTYAITLAQSGELVGCISLLRTEPGTAELGYWVGVPFWGHGFATSAAEALLAFAARELDLSQVTARALSRNPASAKVLSRCGFEHIETREERCGYRQLAQATDYFQLTL